MFFFMPRKTYRLSDENVNETPWYIRLGVILVR